MAATEPGTNDGGDERTGATKCVASHLAAGREAMAAVADYDQPAVDDLARAVAWAVLREDRLTDLTARATHETGVGTQAGTRRKLRGLLTRSLADLLGEPSVGRVDTDREGVVEVAKPVGVVGALVPSTNPASTTAFLAMLAVKGRNAVVVSPPPTAAETVERTVEYVRAELARVDAPRDLVQCVDRPVTREKAHTLLERADFAHVTGSPRNVAAGETAGTPNYCVGAGNAVALVDATADIATAAAAVVAGATFDNGAVCTSESNAVVDARVADEFRAALTDAGAYVCSPGESWAVADVLFADGERRRAHLADPAAEIAAAAGIDLAGDPELLVLHSGGASPTDRPALANEKLAPVCTLYEARGFDAVLDRVDAVLGVEGAGHSCTLHTTHEDRAERLAREVDVCRAVVNQAGGLGLPGVGNDLDTTLSLGAGVWGGNQLDENLTYRHFITTTRVARPVETDPPDKRTLFADYLDRRRSTEA